MTARSLFALSVDQANKVLLAQLTGELSDGVLMDLETAVLAIAEVEGPCRRIMDLNAVSAITAPHRDLMGPDLRNPTAGVTRVFVAPTDYLFGMCRMLLSLQGREIDTRIVRTRKQACDVLGVRSGNFQPLG